MYTTPLSTLTSSLSLNHHLYADDTQHFLSYYPSILTPASLTSRMLCKLYPPGCLTTFWPLRLKTQFLLIGLRQQLANINSCSLHTIHSARNLGFIFDERLTFSGMKFLKNFANLSMTSVRVTVVSSFSHQFIIIIIIIIITFTMHHSISVPKNWRHGNIHSQVEPTANINVRCTFLAPHASWQKPSKSYPDRDGPSFSGPANSSPPSMRFPLLFVIIL